MYFLLLPTNARILSVPIASVIFHSVRPSTSHQWTSFGPADIGNSFGTKMADNEKVSPVTSEPEVEPASTNLPLGKRVTTKDELHEYRENDGYVLDAENSDGSPSDTGVKLAADGHTRLIPQPSDDPRDPLNWSWRKKHIILFIIAAAAFLPDYGSATGAVTLIPQAAYVAPFSLLEAKSR